ncbi:MAG: hypothetical protein SWZ49_29530 [Cyanobacteriota bacterium]|nr:hypothetical protein [Cyanobacteriota bacterium]
MLADVSGVDGNMSERLRISRQKTTASNSSNPSLAPKIPRLAIPAHSDVESNNITSNNITAKTVESETSQEQALVSEERENQENISLKSDSPIENFNYLEKISIFRPQRTVQSQQLAEKKQEQSEVVQRKLNVSESEDKQEELSPLSQAFQIQGNQGDSNNQVTDLPIESFNYLEKASIFRPVEKTGQEMVNRTKEKGSDTPEKAKGDDYANNVQKLLDDINKSLEGFTNPAIEQALTIINNNRPICSVPSSQVTGEDTNTAAYGAYKGEVVSAVGKLSNLVHEQDKKYFKKQVQLLMPTLSNLINSLPQIAVDPRVATVIESNGKPYQKKAMQEINAQLQKLSQEIQKRLKEYLKELFERNFQTKKQKDPKDPPPGGGAGSAIEAT